MSVHLEFNWEIGPLRIAAWTEIAGVALEIDGSAARSEYIWAISRYPGGLITSSCDQGEGLPFRTRREAMIASENYFRKHIRGIFKLPDDADGGLFAPGPKAGAEG